MRLTLRFTWAIDVVREAFDFLLDKHLGFTYIIGHYNPSVRTIGQVSHTTCVCVLILYINGETYILKSTPNDRLFDKLFMAICIYSQSFCHKSAERKSLKEYFLYFVLMSGLRLEPWLYI